MTAGFQSSEHTTVAVTIYRKDREPLIFSGTTYVLDGKYAWDEHHAIIGLQTTKMMGQAGQFTIQLKASRTSFDANNLLRQVVDDDWVDILINNHGTKWHTMRGSIDSVRRTRSVSSGATTQTYTITGRCFQKVWDLQSIYFNTYNGENIDAVSDQLFVPFLGNNVAEVVRAFLFSFIEALPNGRRNWMLPATMPHTVDSDFGKTAVYYATDFTNTPARFALNNNIMTPGFGGMAWQLAKEWSDPLFCELYTELLPTDRLPFHDDAPLMAEGMDIGQSSMVVVMRDIPFPVASRSLPLHGLASPYFKLPMATIPPEMIVTSDLGVSGDERFNAFYVSPQITVEEVGYMPGSLAPHWNPLSMEAHGLRRFDVMTRYSASDNDFLSLSTTSRERLVNWYAVNPFLMQGTLVLGTTRPDIRLGMRVRIPGRSPQEHETFYVEGVSHTWSLSSGGRTTLTVTRGWQGTDNDQITAISDIVAGYSDGGIL